MWLTRARALAPIVSEWRDAGEQDRRLPRPLFEALRDAGMYAVATSRELGGAEIRDERLVQMIEEFSRQDGSVGWNLMIAAHVSVVASAYLPVAGRGDVYTNGGHTVFAGGLLPKGAALRVAGGFRLTGRWTFASGCRQADWIIAPSVVMLDGKPHLRPDGSPEIRAYFVPASECDILDTWYTMGLRGTGSHDYQLTDVYVPEERSFAIQAEGPITSGVLTMRHVLPYAWPSVAAVALGIARDAIDAFIELAVNKTPALSSGALASQHTVHERVGRAEALVRSARAFLYESIRELPASRDWSTPVPDELTARIRLANAHAAQSAAEAVDLMFTAAGTSSIFAGSRLERCFRDVHVVTQHAGVAPSNIEMAGQSMLGLGLHIRR